MAIPAAIVISPNFSNLRVKLGGLALARGRHLERAGSLYRARPWLAFASLLSTYDLARALARSRLKAYFQALGLIFSLAGSLILSRLVGLGAWSLFLIGLLLSVLDFVWEVRGLRDEEDGCNIFRLSPEFDWHGLFSSIIVNQKDILSFGSSYGLYLRTVNTELARQSRDSYARTPIAWTGSGRELPPDIQKWQRQILLNRYKSATGNHPFNGALVRQVTSSEIISSGLNTPIAMQPTRYFDLMCTNYLTDSYVEDRRSGTEVLDGTTLIQDASGRLPRLEDSSLANAVGVSTLAFDSDNKLILIQQSAFAQSSPNLWSPSGSGSLEPNDIFRATLRSESTTSLVDVIRRGMNRELVEESHIPESAVIDSRVIAYFRWLNKGAKPEYVGLTLLDRPVTLLRRRWNEFRWVRGIEVGIAVNFDLLRDDPKSARTCLGKNQAERERYGKRMSFPLFVALHALGERLREDEPEFRRWLLR